MTKFLILFFVLICGCSSSQPSNNGKSTKSNDVAQDDRATSDVETVDENDAKANNDTVQMGEDAAKVIDVSTSGSADAYNFSVRVETPDTGCEQYANWWDVVSEDGTELIYRRILGHSHVDEQPFTRSGGPVAISADQTVVVRVHMNTTGTSVNVMRGSVTDGFASFVVEQGFGASLNTLAPQPTGCAF